MYFSKGRTDYERIEELVLKSGKPGEITGVTNDKGIRRRLGTTGARYMEVGEFAKKLFPKSVRQENAADTSPDHSTAERIDNELKNMWLKDK